MIRTDVVGIHDFFLASLLYANTINLLSQRHVTSCRVATPVPSHYVVREAENLSNGSCSRRAQIESGRP